MKYDENKKRTTAFMKRLLMCSTHALPNISAGLLFLVSEVCESVILKNIDSQMLVLGLASNFRGSSFSFYKNKEVYASIFSDELVCKYENHECSNDIEIYLNDPLKANKFKNEIQKMNPNYFVYTWSDLNKSFFSALKVERNVMFLILTLIITHKFIKYLFYGSI